MLHYPVVTGQAAVDEVGRGCLALDVCAAAVVFPDASSVTERDTHFLEQIKDSKKISAKKRESLADFIKGFASAYGIGTCSPKEIDDHNILNATHIAMHRALNEVERRMADTEITSILVDGDRFNPYFRTKHEHENENENGVWIPHVCLPKADVTEIHVAAASILAKTHRDAIVASRCEEDVTLNERYDFLSNKAYGTPKHLAGLKRFGPTRFHRHSFAPVRLSRVAASDLHIVK